MNRRRRAILVFADGVIVLSLVIVGTFVFTKPSPVGAWAASDSQDWIEFTDQKSDDLSAPSHDGLWVRHRGTDTAGEGMWVRVRGDRHSFDMIAHVSGPMWEKDGSVKLNGQSATWRHEISRDKITTLMRR